MFNLKVRFVMFVTSALPVLIGKCLCLHGPVLCRSRNETSPASMTRRKTRTNMLHDHIWISLDCANHSRGTLQCQ